MCGIAGAVWWDPTQRISADILQRMTDSLRHRGPDAAGAWFCEPGNFSALTAGRPAVALGHRRLSIIDVAGSPQPLGNEDGSVQISFNGEIYNYRELRLQLQQQGHQFRTDGDTEVIVHLYEQYGLDFVQHLRGMFAVAIWDGGSQRLVLARDRLGKKPLFYCQQDQRLVFASEFKALLQIPGLPRKISHSAVLQFLTLQYVPHPDCILQGFQKLPPASIGVLEQGKWRVQRYWSAPYDQPQLQRRTVQDWQEELRAELTEAVRLRLRSDVPLGAFLSGGIDSTIICGLMQSLLQQPVQTFSIGFPVRSFDEREFAAEAAAFLGTSHHEDVVTPDALRILPALIWHYDEPFGDSSAIPTMYLSEMTRRHVTVALTGDGGDELFCGYERYRAARAAALMDRIPGILRRMLAAVATRLPASVEQRSFRRRLKRLLEVLAQDPERRYLNWITIFDEARLQWLAGPQLQPLLRQEDPAQCISA
ncbi:MAG: asparagine synthase (glutamine-hydrolyzing), partial [Actinomycetota bacterium]